MTALDFSKVVVVFWLRRGTSWKGPLFGVNDQTGHFISLSSWITLDSIYFFGNIRVF